MTYAQRVRDSFIQHREAFLDLAANIRNERIDLERLVTRARATGRACDAALADMLTQALEAPDGPFEIAAAGERAVDQNDLFALQAAIEGLTKLATSLADYRNDMAKEGRL